MQVLLFELNGEEYGILLNDVEFISGGVNIVKVPNALEAVTGIVMLRGRAVHVYSLASRWGIAKRGAGYLLVVKVDDINLALEVDLISRVIRIKKEAVFTLPAMIRATQTYFREMFVYGEKLIRLLDVNGLVPSQDRREFCMAVKKCVEEIKDF